MRYFIDSLVNFNVGCPVHFHSGSCRMAFSVKKIGGDKAGQIIIFWSQRFMIGDIRGSQLAYIRVCFCPKSGSPASFDNLLSDRNGKLTRDKLSPPLGRIMLASTAAKRPGSRICRSASATISWCRAMLYRFTLRASALIAVFSSSMALDLTLTSATVRL